MKGILIDAFFTMKKIILFVFVVFIGTSSFAQVNVDSIPVSTYMGTYDLDLEKSKVVWNIGTVRGSQNGEIRFKTGYLEGNEPDNILGKAKFTIDMTSITCSSIPAGIANTQVVLTLKTDNFFDAYRFPFSYLEFVNIKPKPETDNEFEIEGKMTIKGRENEVTFTAKGKFHDGIFEGVAKNISIDRELYSIAYVKTGTDNETVQRINSSLDKNYLIDVYIVAQQR